MSDANYKFQSLMAGRGYGRTHALMTGVANNAENAVLVVHSKQFGEDLRRQYECPKLRIVTPGDADKLCGLHPAYVLDHYTMWWLWGEREREHQREMDELFRRLRSK